MGSKSSLRRSRSRRGSGEGWPSVSSRGSQFSRRSAPRSILLARSGGPYRPGRLSIHGIVEPEFPGMDKPLINGKDLTGWTTHAIQPGHWRVEEDRLTGSGPGTSHLYTTRGDFRDFHLRLEARYHPEGHAGVIFRSTPAPAFPEDEPTTPKGFECTSNSTRNLMGNTGGLRRVGIDGECSAAFGSTRIPPGHWFTLDILVTDNSVAVFVDGVRSAQFVAKGRPFASGHIALQQQTPETVVEFRKIAIREYDLRSKASPDEVQRFTQHDGRVSSIAFDPDASRLITGGDDRAIWTRDHGSTSWGDNTVRIWDVSAGRATASTPGHDPGVRATVFSPDCTLAASCGGWDGPESPTRGGHRFGNRAGCPRLEAAGSCRAGSGPVRSFLD